MTPDTESKRRNSYTMYIRQSIVRHISRM